MITGTQADPLRIRALPENGLRPGGTLVLWVHSQGPLKWIEAEFCNRTQRLFHVKGEKSRFSYRTFLGIPLGLEPGRYMVLVRGKGSQGFILEGSTSVEVERLEVPIQRVRLCRSKAALLLSKALAEEARLFREIFSGQREGKDWAGRFIMPVKGRISSIFGLRRIYNDGLVSWYHKGVDIAGKDGSPVLAPNSGKVVLSRFLKVHGNTVIIDHGQGVFSALIHLRDRNVKRGELVVKGQLIGHVGNTGLSTAPHLHWGLSVGGVRVDPLLWIERALDLMK